MKNNVNFFGILRLNLLIMFVNILQCTSEWISDFFWGAGSAALWWSEAADSYSPCSIEKSSNFAVG
jgi:hypothetical protein